tara:strand:- start:7116 stop:7460 length:345 start_codon:yes stop_codon:yes gene_type:complete
MRLLIILFFIVSCATQNTKPKIQITHVLAVTEQGDTLRLPINMIRSNVYYNIVSYPNYPRYYDNWYNNNWNRNYRNNQPIYVEKNNNKTINKSKAETKDISRLDVNKSKVKLKQ